MKFALFNQLQMPKPWRENAEVLMYREAIEEAVYAEAVGFDAYWQTEHHFYTEIGHSSAPEIVLAAISQRTVRLRLGLGVVVLPCNHPFRVAEYVSTLDVVSGGRVEFGTGRGASPYHVEAFGCAPSASKEVWEESLRVICSMFLHDPFPGWDGKYYHSLPPRDIIPKPVQKPHPPLWVAATSPSTFADAARLGMGVLGLVRLGLQQLKPAINAYREAIVQCDPVGGYVNHQIGAYAICGLDKDYSLGRDIAGAAARWYFGENQAALEAHRFDSQALLRMSNEHLAVAFSIVGPLHDLAPEHGEPQRPLRPVVRGLQPFFHHKRPQRTQLPLQCASQRPSLIPTQTILAKQMHHARIPHLDLAAGRRRCGPMHQPL
jgi:alkanesulfonate monooxygenase SsuD/methylene tetrahydromethanopterin reductase-like flavin-dependent oxidoreductase (luciferase family)